MFKNVIITSGPTIEPIDPVRFISNRSSGKMGMALAEVGKENGVENIYFISGPVCNYPKGVLLIKIETAIELQNEVLKHFEKAEVIIMAAAVSDYRSEKYYTDKMKKTSDVVDFRLIKNPDILKDLGQRKSDNQILVGFAVETEDVLDNAVKKFKEKNLDLLVLNEFSEKNPVFGSDYNQVFLINKRGIKSIKKTLKMDLAKIIWKEIENIKNNNV